MGISVTLDLTLLDQLYSAFIVVSLGGLCVVWIHRIIQEVAVKLGWSVGPSKKVSAAMGEPIGT